MVKNSEEQNENFFKQLEDNYDLMHAQILEKVSNENELLNNQDISTDCHTVNNNVAVSLIV